MPHADSTAATVGTTTRRISSRRAISVTCRPAAPPKATRVNFRGSTPRRTDTMRMPSAMLVLTTFEMPSAATSGSVPSSAATFATAVRAASRPGRCARRESPGRIEEAEDDVGVGDGGRRAALAVGGGTRIGSCALRAHVQDSAGDPGDRPAAGAQRVNVEARQRHLRDAHPLFARELRLAILKQGDVGAGAAHVEGDQIALAEQAHAVPCRPPPRPPAPTARRPPRAAPTRRPGATPPCDCMIRTSPT